MQGDKIVCTACRPNRAITRGKLIDHIKLNHPILYKRYDSMNRLNKEEHYDTGNADRSY